MTVRFKYINSVELDRKGRIQYVKTTPNAGTILPTSCPNIAPVTCFPADPVTDPVGGVNWSLVDYSGCSMVQPFTTNCGSVGTVTNGGFPFEVVKLPGQACPNFTTSGIYNPFPANSDFCEASMTYDSATVVGSAVGMFRSIGVTLRMDLAGLLPGNTHHYKGYLCEIVDGLAAPNTGQLQIRRINPNGGDFSMGGVNHNWVHNDLVTFSVANFFFAGTMEIRVCWKAYINGALVSSGTDFGGAQLLTGKSGFSVFSSVAANPDIPMVSSRLLNTKDWTSCVDVVV